MKDSADIRKVNLYKIRNILWLGDWKTKQEISRETDLSVATCNTLLNELAASGELISEKTRIHNVGPGALRYKINENFESILCVWFDRHVKEDILCIRIVSPCGNKIDSVDKTFKHLTSDLLISEIGEFIEKYDNISAIMVGIPGVAENGVIEHCDVDTLDDFKLIDEFSERFGKMVYMENDMHFKVFGYYQQNKDSKDVVTLGNYPTGVMPGSATVYNGVVIKGHNQFAGLTGFLPYGMSISEQIEVLKSPDTCRDIVSKSIISLIAIQNPSVIVLTGDLLSEDSIEWIISDCKEYIPEEYMPEIIYQDNMDDYYLLGMYRKALELKSII